MVTSPKAIAPLQTGLVAVLVCMTTSLSWCLSHNVFGALVEAQALVRALLNQPARGPAPIFDLRDQHGFDIDRPALGQRIRERAGGSRVFCKQLDELRVRGA